MDTSFWIRYNPKIQIDHTTKKFFGKYLYRLVIYAPAGRIINSKGPLEDELKNRHQMTKNFNQGGWWGYRYNRDLNNANLDFLEKIREIKHNRSLKIKIRVEEPRIQIYAESDKELKDLVQTYFDQTQINLVESISGPEDSTAEATLNSGAIIRKTDNGYKYKVIIRDGRYPIQVKDQLLNYLLSLGKEEIHLSKTSIEMLQKSSGFIWNLYFYTNDINVVTFLNLISPGVISNTHELVVMPHK